MTHDQRPTPEQMDPMLGDIDVGRRANWRMHLDAREWRNRLEGWLMRRFFRTGRTPMRAEYRRMSSKQKMAATNALVKAGRRPSEDA